MSCGTYRERRDLAFRTGFIGRELEAVVIARQGSGAAALTGNNINVAVADCDVPRRELVTVRITEAIADQTHAIVAM